MWRALRTRNYRYWAGADLVSITGTWMQVLGVNWLVLQATGSATRMGLVVALHAAPVLLLGPWAGALADRLPPRATLIVTQAAHALFALGLAVTALRLPAGGPLWPVYLLTLLSGAASALDGPVLGRFGTMVVGPERLGGALAMGSLINSAGRIAGMSLGGVLAATAGPPALFTANAVSFLFVIGALALIRPAELYPLRAAEPGSADAGVRAGFRYLAGQPAVLVTLALAFVLGSVGRNYQVTMATMAGGPLAGGAGGYGLLSTVFAVGAVLGALVAGQLTRLGHGLLIGLGLAAGVLQAVAGLAPGLWSFAALLVPVACAAVMIDTTVSTRVQSDTREDMRGRVVAAMAIVSSLAGMAGAPLLGWLSGAVGPRATLVLAGSMCVLACLGAAAYRFVRSPADPLSPARPVPTAVA